MFGDVEGLDINININAGWCMVLTGEEEVAQTNNTTHDAAPMHRIRVKQ